MDTPQILYILFIYLCTLYIFMYLFCIYIYKDTDIPQICVSIHIYLHSFIKKEI